MTLRADQWRCPVCGYEDEFLTGKRSSGRPECEGGDEARHPVTLMERVPGAPAVHFKGSGFHATDYGKYGPS